MCSLWAPRFSCCVVSVNCAFELKCVCWRCGKSRERHTVESDCRQEVQPPFLFSSVIGYCSLLPLEVVTLSSRDPVWPENGQDSNLFPVFSSSSSFRLFNTFIEDLLCVRRFLLSVGFAEMNLPFNVRPSYHVLWLRLVPLSVYLINSVTLRTQKYNVKWKICTILCVCVHMHHLCVTLFEYKKDKYTMYVCVQNV